MKRGELPIQILSSYNPDTGILTNSTMQNPGIFVPELRKIVYGCGSWWREIKSVDELEAITNEDIENTWLYSCCKMCNPFGQVYNLFFIFFHIVSEIKIIGGNKYGKTYLQ